MRLSDDALDKTNEKGETNEKHLGENLTELCGEIWRCRWREVIQRGLHNFKPDQRSHNRCFIL